MLLGGTFDASRRLRDELDRTATAFASSRSAMEDNKSVVIGLTESLTELRNQEQRLRGSQTALETKAAELIDTYGELGIGLISLGVDYDTVVAAVNRLRLAQIEQGLAAAQSLNVTAEALREARLNSFADETLTDRLGLRTLNNVGRGFTNGTIPGLQAFIAQFGEFQASVTNRNMDEVTSQGAAISEDGINRLLQTLNERFDGENAPRDVNILRQNLIALRSEVTGIVSSVLLARQANHAEDVAEVATGTTVAGYQAQAEALRDSFERAKQAFDQNRTYDRATNTVGPVDERLNIDPGLRMQVFMDNVDSISSEMLALKERLFGPGSELSELEREALVGLGVDTSLQLDPAEFASMLDGIIEQSVEASESVVRVAIAAARKDIESRLENLNQAANLEELAAAEVELNAAVDAYAALRMRQAYLSLGFSDYQINAGINEANFSPIQREATAAARAEIAGSRSTATERVETTNESISTDMRNEHIGALGREIRNLERSLRSMVADMPSGAGRATLDRVLIQQLATIERIEEIERQRLAVEAEDGNLRPAVVASRNEDITTDMNDRRDDAYRAYEDQFRQGSARTFQEAMGDLFESLSETYLSEAARESQSFANGFRDTMLASVGAASEGFKKFFYDVATGASSVSDAFGEMAYSILDSMLQVLTSKISEQLMSMLLNFALAAFGPQKAAIPMSATATFWQGGQIPGISNAFQGKAMTTRDNVLINAAPGEYLLRQSAVNAIGKDNLDQINAMGNRTVSKSAAQMPPMMVAPPAQNTTNVWLVDEQQAPPLGPNDVIAIITRDGMTGGSIKKLIKSVTTGGM
jgi:hypothetical protein